MGMEGLYHEGAAEKSHEQSGARLSTKRALGWALPVSEGCRFAESPLKRGVPGEAAALTTSRYRRNTSGR
jgi:hypothetical protein